MFIILIVVLVSWVYSYIKLIRLFTLDMCGLLHIKYTLHAKLLSHFSRVRLCATPRWQPTRLSRPWDSPGKNTGVGCHFLLQCMKVKSESEVAQSCPTLATPWTAAVVLLGIYAKVMKISIHTKTCTPVYSSFVHNCQNLEAVKMPFSQWIGK